MMTEFAKVREKSRQQDLEHLRKMIEHDIETDEILQRIQYHARAFRDVYGSSHMKIR